MFRAIIGRWVEGRAARSVAAVAIGLAAASAAVAIRYSLVPLTGPSAPFALNFVATVLATALAGWRAGVVAVVASQALTWFLVIEPRMSFSLPEPREAAALVLATVSALFVVFILAIYQRQIDKAWAENERETKLRGVLLYELKHRLKNTLAMVQGMAQQTFRGQGVDDQVGVFQQRLAALGQAHDVLTQSEWSGAAIRQVIETSLEPWMISPDRLQVDGPPVVLPANSCLNFALAFHELATNSAKYGALSNASGRLSVAWRNEADEGFVLEWRETGGPPVEAPRHRGFGTKLIEKAVAAEIGADVQMRFEETGFSCVFKGPQIEQTEGSGYPFDTPTDCSPTGDANPQIVASPAIA